MVFAVLGDMRGLGNYTETAHRAVGRQATQCADMIVSVGEYAKYIAEEAITAGFAHSKIFVFSDADTAAVAIKSLIREGDLVLVKGS